MPKEDKSNLSKEERQARRAAKLAKMTPDERSEWAAKRAAKKAARKTGGAAQDPEDD